MPTKGELADEVERLKKALKERDELLMKAAIKLEELTGTINKAALKRQELAEARIKLGRKNGKQQTNRA